MILSWIVKVFAYIVTKLFSGKNFEISTAKYGNCPSNMTKNFTYSDVCNCCNATDCIYCPINIGYCFPSNCAKYCPEMKKLNSKRICSTNCITQFSNDSYSCSSYETKCSYGSKTTYYRNIYSCSPSNITGYLNRTRIFIPSVSNTLHKTKYPLIFGLLFQFFGIFFYVK